MLRTENGPVDMAESIQDSNRQTRLRKKPHRYRSNEETTTSHQPLVDTNNNNPWVDPDIDAIARASLLKPTKDWKVGLPISSSEILLFGSDLTQSMKSFHYEFWDYKLSLYKFWDYKLKFWDYKLSLYKFGDYNLKYVLYYCAYLIFSNQSNTKWADPYFYLSVMFRGLSRETANAFVTITPKEGHTVTEDSEVSLTLLNSSSMPLIKV